MAKKKTRKYSLENIDLDKLLDDINNATPREKEDIFDLCDDILDSLTVPVISNDYYIQMDALQYLGLFFAGKQIGRQETEAELNKEKGQ